MSILSSATRSRDTRQPASCDRSRTALTATGAAAHVERDHIPVPADLTARRLPAIPPVIATWPGPRIKRHRKLVHRIASRQNVTEKGDVAWRETRIEPGMSELPNRRQCFVVRLNMAVSLPRPELSKASRSGLVQGAACGSGTLRRL